MRSHLIVANVCLAFVMQIGIASSHQKWADCSTVPKWVRSACCGPNDVHHLTPDQVHRVDGGYLVDGHDGVIPLSQTDPSQDGDYWLFGVTVWDGGDSPKIRDVRCLFIPLSY